jgi:hypothetical protein
LGIDILLKNDASGIVARMTRYLAENAGAWE